MYDEMKAASTDRSEIMVTLDGAEKALAQLQDSIAGLLRKVDCVSRPEAPEISGPHNSAPSPLKRSSSPVRERIEQIESRLTQMSATIGSAMQRIET